MIKHLIIGALMIFITSLVHLMATKGSLAIINTAKAQPPNKKFRKLILLDAIVVLMIIAAIVEAMIWAGYFTLAGAIESFEESLYFSIVTYTTLGYGDITLGEEWRILASLEAATGIIIFGWSTANVMSALQNIYFGHRNPTPISSQ